MEEESNLELKIGKKVRALRNEKGFNQEYVAYHLDVPPKTYSNMENNKSSITINTL